MRTRISSSPCLAAGALVVVGREALNDLGAVALGAAVDLLNALDARCLELLVQVASGIAEFREDQDLVFGKNRIVLQQLDQLLELQVLAGFELLQLVQEVGDLSRSCKVSAMISSTL